MSRRSERPTCRSVAVRFRMTEAKAARFAASSLGLSLSAFLRDSALRRVYTIGADAARPIEVRRRACLLHKEATR